MGNILRPYFTTINYLCQGVKRIRHTNHCKVLIKQSRVFSVDNSFLQHYHFTMISFKDIKQHNKILLLFLLILCLSCVIAPIIKAFFDPLVKSSPSIAHLLKYRHESYDFGRVMRRIILVVAILVIFLFRKPLMFRSFTTPGIKCTRDWWQQLQMGFLLGTGIFVLYIAFVFTSGSMTLHIDAKSFGEVILKIIGILLVAGIVGFIEEVFFRGFILQSFLQDMHTVSAVCASSLFYSLLHFFKTKLSVSTGFQPFIGFITVYKSFAHIILNFTSILPSIIGLFLIGVVLSYACLRTKSLYFAIGLHAGWIFLTKTNILLFDYLRTMPKWLFGDGTVITGVLGWILLIITLILIRFVTEAQFYGKNTARTS